MRLLLDAHLSGRVLGPMLRARGHDVRSLSDERELDGLEDEHVLELATRDRRILVTADVGDFAALFGPLAEQERSHEGCILLARIGHHEFAVIVEAVTVALEQHPTEGAWVDRVIFARRPHR